MPTASSRRSLDEVAAALRHLRAEAGDPSFAEIASRIARLRTERSGSPWAQRPGKVTVYDAFRDGRRRIDPELMADIATALGFPERRADLRLLHREIIGERATSTARPEFTAPSPGELIALGREAERVDARGLLTSATPHLLITGMPGVGKTALARAVAGDLTREHRGARVLSIGLRTASGDDGTSAADPDRVLRELSRILEDEPLADSGAPEAGGGVDPAGGGTRLILIVDDVSTSQAVAEFLAGLPAGTTALMTSRRRIDPPESVAALQLGPLSAAGARAMLAALAAGYYTPTDHDPDDLAHLVGACGHLPLAISVLAGQIAARPSWYLSDHRRRLEATEAGLVPALDETYDTLDPDARTVLSFLALHPGPLTPAEVGIALAGTLTAGPLEAAIATLERDNLLTRRADDVLDLHDLVRAVVIERSTDHVPASQRRREILALAASLTQRFVTAESRSGVGNGYLERELPYLPEPDAEDDSVPRDPEGSRRWIGDHLAVAVTTIQAAADEDLPDAVSRLSLAVTAPAMAAYRLLDADLASSLGLWYGLPELYSRHAVQHADILAAIGDIEEAAVLLREVTRVGHDSDRALAYSELAAIEILTGDMRAGLRAGAEARKIPGMDLADVRFTLMVETRGFLLTGQLSQAQETQRLIGVHEEPGQRFITIASLTRLAEIQLELGDAPAAERAMAEAEAYGDVGYAAQTTLDRLRQRLLAIQGIGDADLLARMDRTLNPTEAALHDKTLVIAARTAGRLAEAAEIATTVLTQGTAQQLGAWRASQAELTCVIALAEAGQVGLAQDYAVRATTHAQDHHIDLIAAYGLAVQGYLASLAGDPRADDLLRGVLRDPAASPLLRGWVEHHLDPSGPAPLMRHLLTP